MNNRILDSIKETKFENNKYFKEIIEHFINGYASDNSRVNVTEKGIIVKANDRAGSRTLIFTLKNNCLEVKIDRTVNSYKYQDIILYDEAGIMMKRSKCVANLSENANKFISENPDILTSELDLLGQKQSIYSAKIFKNVDYKEVVRPTNYGLTGSYTHKNVFYDERGARTGSLIEGEFKALEGSNISSLEFPSADKVVITHEEDLSDSFDYQYPNSRKL